jgi:hypothetical protein
LAIIINDEDFEDGDIMSDDGSGSSIGIPSVMIGKNDGIVLKQYLQNLNKSNI